MSFRSPESSPSSILLEDFGQKVDLTRRIREVLLNYPEGTTVLKELIQNADDAGATVVRLCLDRRHHSTTSLLSPSLSAFQGPALLSYNDAVFTEEDFTSISRIGGSVKHNQATKTGRFGVGFNSVYHLTDLPSFVSGNYIVMFDPQGVYLPNVNSSNPGKRIDFVSTKAMSFYRDQFEPYVVFGCDMENRFSGSLFRFPLRDSNQARESKLSRQAYVENDVVLMFEQLYKEGVFSLLFLKNVLSVEMFVWDEGDVGQRKLYSCRVGNLSDEVVWHRKAIMRMSKQMDGGGQGDVMKDGYLVEFESEEVVGDGGSEVKKRSDRFYVVQSMGSAKSRIGEFAATASKDYDIHLLPWASVAACLTDGLSDNDELKLGRAFCFLPLPVRTGLNVQVNGYFEVSSNRRGIWYGADMDRSGKIRSIWNRLLLEDVVAPAFRYLLLGVQQLLGSTDSYYSLWPTGPFEEPWSILVEHIYKRIGDAPVLHSDVEGGKWVTLVEAFLHDEEFPKSNELSEALLQLGMPVVHLPNVLFNMILKYASAFQQKVVTPDTVRDFLRQCKSVGSLNKSYRLVLLEYCLEDLIDADVGKNASNLPLLPLANGDFGLLSEASKGSLFFICNDLECMLLERISDKIIDRDIPPNLLHRLSAIAKSSKSNLAIFSIQYFLKFFPNFLPAYWRYKSKVLWNPESSHDHPTSSWLELFWQYLRNHCEKLSLFGDWPILPSTTGHLYRPSRQSKLINADKLPVFIRDILVKIECKILNPAYGVEHPDLSLYVCDADCAGVVESIFDVVSSAGGIAQTSFDNLRPEDRDELRGFLLAPKWYMGDCIDGFIIRNCRRLPIYRVHGEGSVEGSIFSDLENPEKYLPPLEVPDNFLGHEFIASSSNIEEDILLRYYGVERMGKAHFYRQQVFNNVRILQPEVRDRTMLSVLQNLPQLCVEDASFRECLRNLEFVPTFSGTLKHPSVLYDPRNEELWDLLEESDSFPCGAFQEPNILDMLHGLGLRTTASPETVIESARQVERLMHEDQQKAHSRGKVLLSYLEVNAMKWLPNQLNDDERTVNRIFSRAATAFRPRGLKSDLEKFWNDLRMICWCPVMVTAPFKTLPWPIVTSMVAPPKLVRLQADLWLVSASMRILDGECSSTALSYNLGWLSPPGGSAIAAQLLELGKNNEIVTDQVLRQELALEMPKIYSIMTSLIGSDEMDIVKAVLEGSRWIWVGDGFATADEVVLDGPLHMAPYIRIIPMDLAVFKELFLELDIREYFKPMDYANILGRMAVRKGSSPLDAQEIRAAILIVQHLAEVQFHEQVKIYLPDVSGRLFPATDLVYNDAPWLLGSDNSDSSFGGASTVALHAKRAVHKFVHGNISNEVAEKLGVCSLRRILLAESSDSMNLSLSGAAEAFGQHEALTTRLKHILEMYADGPGILFELVQNAEDAGASEVIFLLDKTHYGTSSVLSPEMADWQGPALYCFNNSVFSSQDLYAISRIGQESKLEKPFAIGRFGLGFNCVYHFTDIPTFVSGENVVMFDPHACNLPGISPSHPGLRIKFTGRKILEQFPDQFSPFLHFGCDLQHPFPGTLFRFPLRSSTVARRSLIKKEGYAPERCHEGNGSEMQLLHRVQRNCITEPEMEPGAVNDRFSFVNGSQYSGLDKDQLLKILSKSVDKNPPHKCQKIVVTEKNSSGVMSHCWITGECLGSVRAKSFSAVANDSHESIPWASVAAYIHSVKVMDGELSDISSIEGACTSETFQVSTTSIENRKNFEGRAFCFLPLPISTGLPAHINSYFALSSNRRDIWFGNDMAGGGKKRSDWNIYILEDVAAPAYGYLLEKIASEIGPCDLFFSYWPMETGLEPWASMVHELVEALSDAGLPLFLMTLLIRRRRGFKDRGLIVVYGLPLLPLSDGSFATFEKNGTGERIYIARGDEYGLLKGSVSHQLVDLEIPEAVFGKNGNSLVRLFGLPLVPNSNVVKDDGWSENMLSLLLKVGCLFLRHDLPIEHSKLENFVQPPTAAGILNAFLALAGKPENIEGLFNDASEGELHELRSFVLQSKWFSEESMTDIHIEIIKHLPMFEAYKSRKLVSLCKPNQWLKPDGVRDDLLDDDFVRADSERERIILRRYLEIKEPSRVEFYKVYVLNRMSEFISHQGALTAILHDVKLLIEDDISIKSALSMTPFVLAANGSWQQPSRYVSLYTWDEGCAKPCQDYSVSVDLSSATMRNPFSEKKWRKFQLSRLFSSSNAAVKLHVIDVSLYQGSARVVDRWLVVLSLGSGQTRNMALDRRYLAYNLTPVAGVAAHISRDGCPGDLFPKSSVMSPLPLSGSIALPVTVLGCFLVRHNSGRSLFKYQKKVASEAQADAGDQLIEAWNKELMSCVRDSYIEMVVEMQKLRKDPLTSAIESSAGCAVSLSLKAYGDLIYSFWPRSTGLGMVNQPGEPLVSTEVPKADWGCLIEEVIRPFYARVADLPLWQLYTGNLVKSGEGMFLSQPGNGVGDSLLPATVCGFVKEHYPVFSVPWELVTEIQAVGVTVREIKPKMVRDLLKMSSTSIVLRSVDTYVDVVEYCLSDIEFPGSSGFDRDDATLNSLNSSTMHRVTSEASSSFASSSLPNLRSFHGSSAQSADSSGDALEMVTSLGKALFDFGRGVVEDIGRAGGPLIQRNNILDGIGANVDPKILSIAAELKGLPCPTATNHLTRFGVTELWFGNKDQQALMMSLAAKFIHPKVLDRSLLFDIFSRNAIQTLLRLKSFSLHLLASHMKLLFHENWVNNVTGSNMVPWFSWESTSSSGGEGGPSHEWLRLFWKCFGASSGDLPLFSDWPLIPAFLGRPILCRVKERHLVFVPPIKQTSSGNGIVDAGSTGSDMTGLSTNHTPESEYESVQSYIAAFEVAKNRYPWLLSLLNQCNVPIFDTAFMDCAVSCNCLPAPSQSLGEVVASKLVAAKHAGYFPELASFSASDSDELVTFFAQDFLYNGSAYRAEELEVLRGLPIYKTVVGSYTRLHAQDHCMISSSSFLKPSDERCLSYSTDSIEFSFLRALGVPELHDQQILMRFGLPDFEDKPQSEQEDILIYLYTNWQDLQADSSLLEVLKETKFVRNADEFSLDRSRPKDLFDPGDALLTSVFSGERKKFPGERFSTDGWLLILRKTGLQTAAEADVILECAKRVEFLGSECMKSSGDFDDFGNNVSHSRDKVTMEIWALAGSVVEAVLSNFAVLYGNSFCNQLGKIACVPAELGFPNAGGKKVLTSYSEAIVSKDWPLAWSSSPIISRQNFVPPEYSWGGLQLRSPPAFSTVLKHLQVIGRNGGEDTLAHWPTSSGMMAVDEASCEVLKYLDKVWSSLSSSDRENLQRVAFLPAANGTRLVTANSLFVRLTINLSPFAFELPTLYLPFVKILKELGLQDMLSVAAAKNLLIDLQKTCGYQHLNPNELRAVMEILFFLCDSTVEGNMSDWKNWTLDAIVPDDGCRLVHAQSCVYIDSYGSRYVKYIDTSRLRFVHGDIPERICIVLGIRKLSDVVIEELDKEDDLRTLEYIGSVSVALIREKLLSRSFQGAVWTLVNSIANYTPARNTVPLETLRTLLESVAEKLQFVKILQTHFMLLPKSLDVTLVAKDSIIPDWENGSKHRTLYFVNRSRTSIFVAEPPTYVSVLDVVAIVVSQVLGSPTPLPIGTLFLCPEGSESAILNILKLSSDKRDIEPTSNKLVGKELLPPDALQAQLHPLRPFYRGEIVAWRSQNGEKLKYGRVPEDVRPSAGQALYRFKVETAPGVVEPLLSSQVFSFKGISIGNEATSSATLPDDSHTVVDKRNANDVPESSGRGRTRSSQGGKELHRVSPAELVQAVHEMLSEAGISVDVEKQSLLERTLTLQEQLKESQAALLLEQEKADVAAKEADTAKAAWLCRVCLTNEVDMTIVPCGHVLCRRCSSAVSRCPFCRLQVAKTIRIFRP
ncbi:hypothetical protein POTOM_021004 [Populus tomentosa]|uniref:RING-type domain-containing protein n=1 Tax=Populus tomentosa TaxID=118781 RepID=A0A8X8D2M5_POPTO|nr:hypothetical protein POTOM_021004 [Populus tomentosa]